MSLHVYLGIDVGSVSTNLVALSPDKRVVDQVYLRTKGNPVQSAQAGLEKFSLQVKKAKIIGVGVTGSGRQLIGKIMGADIIKNEITAHGVAALTINPEVKTIFEIGGQDSKIMILREGTVVDFAMNTVCAAGTGSFLDQQANRLNISINDLGRLALQSKTAVRIAGRCSVFAESDMIHKQQMGYFLEDIVAGLCKALVRNYFNNVGKGKEILPPVFFQGGVAANAGIKAAFEEELGYEIVVPEHYESMGALGAALLARESRMATGKESGFRGFELCEKEIKIESFDCPDCANNCEVITVLITGKKVASWGDKCGKHQLISSSLILTAKCETGDELRDVDKRTIPLSQ